MRDMTGRPVPLPAEIEMVSKVHVSVSAVPRVWVILPLVRTWPQKNWKLVENWHEVLS